MYAGSGDSVAVRVNASDPDNDPLTYSYSATGGTVLGTGPDARWSSTGVPVGVYTVNAKVDDGKGGTASCAADIKVEEKPNHPPTASLAVERSPILPGERTGVTCTGSDPDNDPLTYSYTATGGQIVGSSRAADICGPNVPGPLRGAHWRGLRAEAAWQFGWQIGGFHETAISGAASVRPSFWPVMKPVWVRLIASAL